MPDKSTIMTMDMQDEPRMLSIEHI